MNNSKPMPDRETATPLTDAAEFSGRDADQALPDPYSAKLVTSDFARTLETTSAALRREVEALRGALAPFAELIKLADVSDNDADSDPFMTSATPIQTVCGVKKVIVTVGDLRRAATVFATAPSAPLTADAREGERLAQFFPTNGLIPIWAQTAGHGIAHSKHKRSLDLTGKSVSGVIVRHYRSALAAQSNKGTT